MRILIVNDDGIEADGIRRLAEAAVKYGEVWVVAPVAERSAASHSIYVRNPIDVYEREYPVKGVRAFAVDATPADCVRVGMLNLLPQKPDIVFSGINNGYNAGTDVQYSATVGAAMEAVFQGVPAVAFSEGSRGGREVAVKYLDTVMSEVIQTKYVPMQIVNVNFPECHVSEVKGILRDRKTSTVGIYLDRYLEEKREDGGRRFRLNGILNENVDKNSDLEALLQNYITIGPVTNIH